jgi:hypothetical protein
VGAAVELPRAVFAVTVLIPVAWTVVVLNAFCAVVLAVSRREARIRVAAHQALVWVVALNYVVWNAGGWSRFGL